MPIGLVLADDHPIILDGLDHLFRQEEDFKVLARCRDGEETLQAVRKHRPDVLILDLRMPGKDGLAVLREVRKEKRPTRVVLLTAEMSDAEALEAIRLRVNGVVLKEMAPQLLVKCIHKVHAGGQWWEKRSLGRAMETMLRREAGEREIAGVLTPRELQIVRLVASGLHNKEIADKLTISEGTVKIHLHHIYEKLHVDGRLELTLYAQDKGLV
ncbi:MAG: response regulator transcription factor [candidate division NC10 bacterium]|nr:response regulator transcription factor [candidate division NC10 bacterium]